MLEIRLRTTPDAPPAPHALREGTTLAELAAACQPHLPYRILAARVDNQIQELTKAVREPCDVTLLDIRDPAGNRIYQRSVSFIYLKAVHDVLGSVRVNIENSLNKGLYTQIRTKYPVTEDKVARIEARMRELVQLDIPFVRRVLDREEALALLPAGEHEEKRKMMQVSGVSRLPIYTCGDYSNFFYGYMVPSAGYIRHFELRKYRNGILLRFPSPLEPDRIPAYRDDSKLYQAFGESKKWGDLMGVSYVSELNQKVESGEYREIIQISEALHEKKIALIADQIRREKKRIILIAGPSSSGKTTFAKRLCIQLMVNGQKPLYLGTDDYFVERHQTPRLHNGDPNFEDIEALDLDLFNDNMNSLLAGETVDLPVFNFLEGTKQFGQRIVKAQSNQPIVIEGIHGLNRTLTERIPEETKFKIYISPLTQLNIDNHNRVPTTDARLLRRLVRDHRTRGYSASKTFLQWPKVRAGEDKNIFPYNGEADVLFNSALLYEIGVMKRYAEPLLANISPEDEAYSEAVRLLKFLKFFRTIEDDTVIANNSILREFIGGSILA